MVLEKTSVSKKSKKATSKKVKKKATKEVASIKKDAVLEKKDIDSNNGEKPASELKSFFDVFEPDDPLVGAPKDVQEELDALAVYLQDNPEDEVAFNRIVHYIHKYLLGLVFRKFSYIKGYSEEDVWQEALVTLSQKAIPGFDPTRTGKDGRKMSFLNYAKLCIGKRLTTLLNTSITRKKDFPLNNSVSLDYNPTGDDGDESCTLANIITDEENPMNPSEITGAAESREWLTGLLRDKLSDLEKSVFDEFMNDQTYREMAKGVTKKTGDVMSGPEKPEKRVDNALLRIRKKARIIIEQEMKKGNSVF